MRKLFILSVLGTLALGSCTDLDDESTQKQLIKENAENVFGIIDPNQNWSNINSGTISVTADATLKDITKVQILTESPFFNDQAKVLAEADAIKGQTVTINYDAPKTATRLVAACVDTKGNCIIKPFNVGDTQVGFKSSSNARTRSVRRAADDLPDFSKVNLIYNNTVLSYNAQRTIVANDAEEPQNTAVKAWIQTNAEKTDNGHSANINIANWKGKNWENDRLWKPSDQNNTNSSWIVDYQCIRRDADPLDADEEAVLHAIFDASLFRADPNNTWGRRDNLKYIREGNAVRFFNNHLVSDGKNPITLSPIQLSSGEIYWCDLYYYYYKPSDIPAGTSETDYIKSLPKFKAMDLYYEREQFRKTTSIDKTKDDTTFMRLHEYLLPFYGAPSNYMPKKVMASSLGSSDGKLYRIKNSTSQVNGKDYYMTYTSQSNQTMQPRYEDAADNVVNQLWQIFTTSSGYIMLYNVGSKKFMVWTEAGNGDASITDSYTDASQLYYSYRDNHLYQYNHSWRGLKFNYNTNWWQEKYKVECPLRDPIKDTTPGFNWEFEEYNGTKNITPATDAELKKYPSDSDHPTPSAIIEEGYRIGFLLRKEKNSSEMNNQHLTESLDGCLYGNGQLNTEINRFGQFASSTADATYTNYTMNIDDPRIGMFNANGKTYLCFEDGSDAQYSDMIVELGGISTSSITKESAEGPDVQNANTVIEDMEGKGGSGVFMFDQQPEIPGMAYTMCFEDRPGEADFDLNDVVLRCIRNNNDRSLVQFSIVAIGASDELQIGGIEGTPDGKYDIDLMEDEVHVYFHAEDLKGDDRFINTIHGKGDDYTPVSSWYRVNPDLTLPQLLSKIYIINKTRNTTIRVPQTGEAPCALIIPGDFDYPRETQSILGAYSNFLTWVHNVNQYANWTEFENYEVVIQNQFKK